MTFITLDILTRAIVNRLTYSHAQARKTAEFLLDIFGYDDRIIDNVLDPENRQLFYLLESVGIVSNGREETILYDGREWRTHYWLLEKEDISYYADQPPTSESFEEPTIMQKREERSNNIYDSLSDDVWTTRKVLDNKSPFLS